MPGEDPAGEPGPEAGPGNGPSPEGEARGGFREGRGRSRRLLLRLHRWVGVVTGLFITVTAGTGLVLQWTEELNLRARPEVEPWREVGPLEAALPGLAAAHPGYALTSIRAEDHPRRAWTVFLRHPETDARVAAEIDPGTGRLLGTPDYHRTPFRQLLDLHYMYGMKAAGQVAATLAAAALVFLAVSGLVLYTPPPREWFRWRFSPRRPLAGALWLHRWAGAWACALAILWGLTALVLMASILPQTLAPDPERFMAADPAQLARLAPFAPMVAEAQARFPEAELRNILPPRPGVSPEEAETRLLLLFRSALPWNKFGEVRFGAFAGEVRAVVPPEQRTASQRLDAAVASLHYGNLGARGWQVAWTVGGLLLLSQPLTGYVLWVGRRRR